MLYLYVMSTSNPYEDDIGYVKGRRCSDGGHVVLYDKKKGVEWLESDMRWVLIKYSSDKNIQGQRDFKTKEPAAFLLENTVLGKDNEWYDKLDGWR